MPELPEVETTRRGIAPHIEGRQILRVIVRNPNLRWPIPRTLDRHLSGQTVEKVSRRAKYLLLTTAHGTALLHLGMSGSLRIIQDGAPAEAHDHVDICFTNGRALRLRDPRRFGALLWAGRKPEQHPLLENLGPEPLGEDFNADYLYRRSRGRRIAIKPYLMDSHTVAGIGNIYANEALFLAGIHPLRAAGRISINRYEGLTEMIRRVLGESIQQGGTTLRDFVNDRGEPGYFRLYLHVYGRTGDPCPVCAMPVREIRQSQRATYYCAHCQK